MTTTTLRAGLSALALTAVCAGAASAQEVRIWGLTSDNETVTAAWEQVIADFQAANPGITIIREERSTDEHKSALRIAAQSDQAPDIYFMWAGLGLGGEFVNAGLSLPLDDYYASYGWDDHFWARRRALPATTRPTAMACPTPSVAKRSITNTALFAEAGITELPDTYDELKVVAQQLADAGIPAFTFGGTVNWHVMRLMDVILEAKCGAETHDALMGMTVDWATTPCATESFAELADWSANYILSPFMGIDQAQSFGLFMGDRAAMMLEGDWLVGQLQQEGREGRFRRPSRSPPAPGGCMALARTTISRPPPMIRTPRPCSWIT